MLDACLAQDPRSRVACETYAKCNLVVVGGEITTKARLDYTAIAREAIREIGYTDASPADGVEPSPETLVHGAADAMLTAVKRLEGRPARLVVVIESAERHRKLGAGFAEEWTAMRGALEERTPCVGWLGGHVAAFGRGVQPTDAPGALIAVALGDAPK